MAAEIERLKPLQQAVQVVKLIAGPLGVAGAPAQFIENFPGPLEIGLVRQLHIAGIDLAEAWKVPAQGILRLAELVRLGSPAVAGLAPETLGQRLHHRLSALLE
jgi:hypothetical protein